MSDVIPTFRYRDADAAIAFLESAFGAEEHGVHRNDDGSVVHAELSLGDGMVMLGSYREDQGFPLEPGGSSTYVIRDDVDELFARAQAAGAQVVMGLTDQDYGSREFTVRDPEGNRWSFGTYRPS